jgi:hypothetical protein
VSVDDALARFRARWAHPPLDRRDVEERLAVRLLELPDVEVLVVATPPACRLFVRRGEGWRSRYVHRVDEVDRALDALRSAA